MAGEPLITVVGNLVADPEARVSQAGKSWVSFRIASTPRVRDRQSGDWSDGEPLFLGCRAFGEYADNIAASLTKGTRVIVQGRLTQHTYEKDGQQRTSLDLEVEEVGPTLRWSTASITRAGAGPAGGGYARTGNGTQPAYGQTQGGGFGQPQGQSDWTQPTGGFDDEQPF
ncbi:MULTISPECIES: single-stranded DNA-binding protein [unclassified Leucobacter]|uniref:single-stranded DNA-binding protein n=1 Tax=unclassified Leucobacter TaxID=2621730 RepID=UPI000622363F|nr:single-stranded DNA-binding protein [Leucobacter sp. Ag1]KKI18735.1 single-stranded DNA-binding protein [Leucobacter sp. Ag1]